MNGISILKQVKMANYQICTVCIMDTSDSDIFFDALGQCNHCKLAEKNLKFFEQLRDNSLEPFLALIEEIKSNPGKEGFHGIIGVSGGVDSSFLLHKLRESGLKLLAVHVDAGWNAIEAVQNINKMVTDLDIELETIVINWEEIKEIQKAYLRSGVSNQDVPQDHAFFSSLYKLARQYDIKYVISGSNFATESILPRSWGQNAMDGRQLKAIVKKHGNAKLKTYPITFLNQLYYHIYVNRDYKVVAPLNYLNYSKESAVKELQEAYDWADYGGKHKESRFTNFFQEVYLPERFGIDKKRAHLSSLIVNQEMTREDALSAINSSHISELDRNNLIQFVSNKLGLTVLEMEAFIGMPFKSDKYYRNEGYLNLLIDLAVKGRNFARRIVKK
jgi:N-acetyl sugar amidotransferase